MAAQENKAVLIILGLVVVFLIYQKMQVPTQAVIVNPAMYSQMFNEIDYLNQYNVQNNITEPAIYVNSSSYFRQLNFSCGYDQVVGLTTCAGVSKNVLQFARIERIRAAYDGSSGYVNGYQVSYWNYTQNNFTGQLDCTFVDNMSVCFSQRDTISTFLNMKYPAAQAQNSTCAQVITPACNPVSYQIYNYSTPCAIPSGWTTDLTKCQSTDSYYTKFTDFFKNNYMAVIALVIIAAAVIIFVRRRNK